ncbi:hypothetical protein R3P38DRAFT_2811698 [Favolaschia claudopus]|uniref:Uncharacterized protein n=1 Tax=Favolaschia claudopus TaxID=2862362 RepID=A0AAV9Z8J4_9AGAR
MKPSPLPISTRFFSLLAEAEGLCDGAQEEILQQLEAAEAREETLKTKAEVNQWRLEANLWRTNFTELEEKVFNLSQMAASKSPSKRPRLDSSNTKEISRRFVQAVVTVKSEDESEDPDGPPSSTTVADEESADELTLDNSPMSERSRGRDKLPARK